MNMRLRRIAALALATAMMVSVFTACSGKSTDASGDSVEVISTGANGSQQSGEIHEANADDEGYYFVVNNVKLRPNADLNKVLSSLPNDPIYFEAPSCAGIGMAKTYTYDNGSYVISTIPLGNKDLISTIVLYNDSVGTPEGIFIGNSADDVKAKYGTPTSDIDGALTYEKNDTMLVIITEDGVVTSIVYNSIV
jgi:hypothetical protein